MNVLKRISSNGADIIRAMIPNDGKPWGESVSAEISRISGGAGITIFFAINLPKNGPAMIAHGRPTINPKRMTHPISTLRIFATAIGPGVGGTIVWVTARPARRGIA